MMLAPRPAALCLSLLALGCGRVAHVPAVPEPAECRRSEEWLAQFAIRRATTTDAALVRANRAGLAVQARSAFRATDSVVTGAQLRLFRADSVVPAALLATGAVDSSGWWLVDRPALGSVFIHARWFGYVPRGEVVTLRTGFRDTILVHLRWDLVCIGTSLRSPTCC